MNNATLGWPCLCVTQKAHNIKTSNRNRESYFSSSSTRTMRLINNLGNGRKSKGFIEKKSEHESILLLEHAVQTNKLLLLLYFSITT